MMIVFIHDSISIVQKRRRDQRYPPRLNIIHCSSATVLEIICRDRSTSSPPPHWSPKICTAVAMNISSRDFLFNNRWEEISSCWWYSFLDTTITSIYGRRLQISSEIHGIYSVETMKKFKVTHLNSSPKFSGNLRRIFNELSFPLIQSYIHIKFIRWPA